LAKTTPVTSAETKQIVPNVAVQLENVVKKFGTLKVLEISELTVTTGQILAIAGHSGCGKTTLLRLIAGLEEPSQGRVKSQRSGDGKNGLAGMVFQHPVLMPQWTVRQNLALGWRLHYNQWSKFWWEKTESSELRQRLDEAVQLLELDLFQQRLPSELSGGQRQRVALGRCLVRRPAVFLLDEPLSNLDPALVSRLLVRLRDKFRAWGSTVLWVTHDQAEAEIIADRCITMTEGLITSDNKRVKHERS
jgi:ABC-type sugar transport system ATPase subunit